MKPRNIWIILLSALLVLAGICVLFERPVAREIIVSTNGKYQAGKVYVQVYSGTETPTTQWLVIGTGDRNTRLVIDAGANTRSYLLSPGCKAVRNDAAQTVKVERRWMGVLYRPVLELILPSYNNKELLVYNAGDATTLLAQCETALNYAEDL